MLSNCNYDLIETIAIISKSLARYETYMRDCAEHESCMRLWSKIRSNREGELRMLLEELNSVAQKGGLSAQEKKSG